MLMDLISSLPKDNTTTQFTTGMDRLKDLKELKNADSDSLFTNREESSMNVSENKSSFEETLNAVNSEKDTATQPEKQTSEEIRKLDEKVQELEKKVEEIKENPELSENIDVEKLQALIDKLKEFIERQSETDSKVVMKTENGAELDFAEMMTQIIDQINQILDQPQMNDSALDQLNTLIETAEVKADDALFQMENAVNFESDLLFHEADIPEWDMSDDTSNDINLTKEESESKVEVVDLRGEKITETEQKQTDTSADFSEDEGFQMTENENGEVEFKFEKDMKDFDSIDQTETVEKPTETVKTAVSEIPVVNESGELEFVQVVETSDSTTMISEPAQVKNVAAQSYTQFSNPVSRANLEALMQGIAGKAMVTLEEGKSEMRMKLFPPELGQMNMKLSFEDGQMIGKIVVQTQEAKMLFDQNMTDLQNAMQESGIDIGSLDVSLSQSGNPDEDFELFGEISGIGNVGEKASNGSELVQLLAMRGSLIDSSINLLA